MQEFVKRTQSDFPYTYGLGEKVIDGVYLFRSGNYNLTEEQYEKALQKAKRDNLRKKENE